MRKLLQEAKACDPKFLWHEARSTKGDFLFIGSGHRPGLKNVVVIRPDGTVFRMEADPALIKTIEGGGTSIFSVILDSAEQLVAPGS